jgi:hypothetical protein
MYRSPLDDIAHKPTSVKEGVRMDTLLHLRAFFTLTEILGVKSMGA